MMTAMATEKIPAINDAADKYYDVVRERMGLTEQEVEAKASLLAAMKENQKTEYETPDGLVVTLSVSEGVKCKRKKELAPDISLNGDADE